MAAERTSVGLPAHSRIQKSGDFAAARNGGRRLVKGCLILNWLGDDKKADTRLGVITSKKIGGAVVRNRARRLLREAFRLNQQKLVRPVDLILVARASIVGKALRDVEKDYLAALSEARLLKIA